MNSTLNINLAALSHNVSLIRTLAPNQEICGVVKANAYNHGLLEVTKSLYSQGIRWFAVTNIKEAKNLHDLKLAGINILIFASNFISYIDEIVSHDFVVTIHSVEVLESLAGLLNGRTLRCHIEVDTGMSRTGISEKDISQIPSILRAFPNIIPLGIFSHYASADSPDDDLNNMQQNRFDAAVEELINNKITFPYCHIANSAGISLQLKNPKTNMVRPGIMLYGIDPGVDIPNLKPVMSWHTTVTQIRSIAKGQGVSYSQTWKADKDSTIAIISAGYADGYPRQASNKGSVIINNQKAPIIGNICMDFMMVDISECANISVADDVILIGKSDSLSISSTDVANWAGTISYDILCAAGKRANPSYQP